MNYRKSRIKSRNSVNFSKTLQKMSLASSKNMRIPTQLSFSRKFVYPRPFPTYKKNHRWITKFSIILINALIMRRADLETMTSITAFCWESHWESMLTYSILARLFKIICPTKFKEEEWRSKPMVPLSRAGSSTGNWLVRAAWSLPSLTCMRGSLLMVSCMEKARSDTTEIPTSTRATLYRVSEKGAERCTTKYRAANI